MTLISAIKLSSHEVGRSCLSKVLLFFKGILPNKTNSNLDNLDMQSMVVHHVYSLLPD